VIEILMVCRFRVYSCIFFIYFTHSDYCLGSSIHRLNCTQSFKFALSGALDVEVYDWVDITVNRLWRIIKALFDATVHSKCQ